MKTMNYNTMSESEKILTMIDLLGATSENTAVITENIVGKGIEEGATTDTFTENWHGHLEGDHPWWFLLAAMSGVGSEDDVAKYNVPYLHRKKVMRMKNGRKVQSYAYWYDESFSHEITYTGKEYKEKMRKEEEARKRWEDIKNKPSTLAEAQKLTAQNPENLNINGKYIPKWWFKKYPEKGKELYGEWLMSNPEIYTELYGNS